MIKLKRMRRLGLALGLILSAALPATVTPGQAATITSPGQVIDLEVSNGTLVQLAKPAGSVFIADPEVADIQIKSPRLVYVFGKKPGTTTLYALTDKDEVIFSGTVRINHNLSEVRSALQRVMPGKNIDIQELGGLLLLTGDVKSPAEAADAAEVAQRFVGKNINVLNRISVATPTQVNIRVRVAEVSRDVSKQLGFNWEGAWGGKTFIGIQNAADVFRLIPDPAGGPGLIKEFFTSSNAGSYFGSVATGKLDLNGVIDALETEGFLTVLAEPNLTALSGEFASFLAGGEFPIPVPQENGVITIEYRSFGVGLEFTPTVSSNNSINLKIQPEVSQLSSAGSLTLSGFNVPALTTRRAETTVELASGQSFAIAGLLQNNIERELQKFPGLGDIPILGALFRSDRFRRQETELIIIVTPYIVRPVSASIPTPLDGLQMPNDVDRYLHGQSYKASSGDAATPPLHRDGSAAGAPAGFILN